MTTRRSKYIADRLAQLVQRSRHAKAELTREAILQCVEDSEDAYDAERILHRVRAGRERTYTLDEVAERLGFDDEGGLS